MMVVVTWNKYGMHSHAERGNEAEGYCREMGKLYMHSHAERGNEIIPVLSSYRRPLFQQSA